MSLKEKLFDSRVSRRSFLKGMAAVGTTAALYGCGSGGDGAKSYIETDTMPTPPEITGTVVSGATPHNCGGRCSSKYYIDSGVVKRIVTDEGEETGTFGNGDYKPQLRSCVRCRSRKQWFYRADRLKYPLKQTGERGDINGFIRITWEQAYSEIAQKMQDIYDEYGPEAFYLTYGSGDSTGWAGASVSRLLAMFGGGLRHRNDYSWPALDHIATFIEGVGYTPEGNSRGDAVNADEIFLWSYNGLEAIWGSQSGWYLTQLKEMGKKITVVDTRFSMTAATLADDFVNITPGTDSALVLGMLYYMLKERYDDLDINFIKSHIHGFFDDPNAVSYHNNVTDYIVPAGASLSAYIFGNESFLVDKGENLKISIYPDEIGYNVNSEDELYGKTTRIYGQIPKTPEWAEKITGVPSATIKKMADTLLDRNVTIWNGSGMQRNTESEQCVWLLRIMSAVTKNFGKEGCSYGMQRWSWVSGPSNGMSRGITPPSKTADFSFLYDGTKVSSFNHSDFYHGGTQNTIPVFLWQDAVENAGTGKSRWNDGQIKRLKTPIKAVFTFAGNVLNNQSGDLNYYQEVFKNRSKVDLIVAGDHWMTASAQFADYVLPCAMQMEKPGASTGWFSTEVVSIPQVLTPLEEAKSEYDICAGIAGALGREQEYTEGKTMEQRLKEGWESGKFDISWEEFREKGVWKPNLPITIAFKKFRDDPANNPINTPSGKFEAYSKFLMEDYQARGYNNYDTSGTLENDGLIPDADNPGGSNSRRFVYPIPMYIPPVEGRHADGSHPDPLGMDNKGYKFTLHTWHIMYRSHSTLNNVAYLDELYKKDIKGKEAFLPEDRASLFTWEDGVYEPIWLNSEDAALAGIQTGDRVLIENDRGKIYASAIVTQRVPRNIIAIGQGAWHHKNNSGIDVGGCANTLTHARPSRICQGMTLANDCRVKISKAKV